MIRFIQFILQIQIDIMFAVYVCEFFFVQNIHMFLAIGLFHFQYIYIHSTCFDCNNNNNKNKHKNNKEKQKLIVE